MYYLDKVQETIRREWFRNHIVLSKKGEESFQEIIWGAPCSNKYQVKYVFSGNTLFVSGDLGGAIYSWSTPVTLNKIKECSLGYFMSKLLTTEKEKFDFDRDLAQQELTCFFLDFHGIEDLSQLGIIDKQLYASLIHATYQHSLASHFVNEVYTLWRRSSIHWFDENVVMDIASCGQRLSYNFIAHWLGLQMIAEL